MEEFSPHNGINWQGDIGVVNYDRGQMVMFYNKEILNTAKSRETGRPVYDTMVHVRIQPVGERPLNVNDRPATEADRIRWPVQWAKFKQGNPDQQPEGVPIDLLYPNQPSIGANLRQYGVFTIEQCAELSGNAVNDIGLGAQQYVNDAKKYLEYANKGVGLAQMNHELEKRDRELKLLQQQVTELTAALKQARSSQAQPDLAAIQTMIAQAMQRPEHMPMASFDPQTAIINATHGSVDEQPKKAKRSRTKFEE